MKKPIHEHADKAPIPLKKQFTTTFWYCNGKTVAKQTGNGEIEYLDLDTEVRDLSRYVKEQSLDVDAYAEATNNSRNLRRAQREEFENDLKEHLGIVGNPKADLLIAKAWDQGHACGLQNVVDCAEELVDLIR